MKEEEENKPWHVHLGGGARLHYDNGLKIFTSIPCILLDDSPLQHVLFLKEVPMSICRQQTSSIGWFRQSY